MKTWVNTGFQPFRAVLIKRKGGRMGTGKKKRGREENVPDIDGWMVDIFPPQGEGGGGWVLPSSRPAGEREKDLSSSH